MNFSGTSPWGQIYVTAFAVSSSTKRVNAYEVHGAIQHRNPTTSNKTNNRHSAKFKLIFMYSLTHKLPRLCTVFYSTVIQESFYQQ